VAAPVARRYAKALFELSRDNGEVEAVEAQLSAFAAALDASAELRNVLTTPGLPLDQRQGLLKAIVDKAGGGRTARNLLLLLVERGRLPLLSAIVDAFRAEADRAAGRVRARVTSAAELTVAQVDDIRKAFERSTGKRVEVETTVDPDLIGGVVAQVGSLVYDGSLKSSLRRLREQIARGTGPAA
jgi:F-type H+-transporting ATPase subunit delta